jgi:hypothetical protein
MVPASESTALVTRSPSVPGVSDTAFESGMMAAARNIVLRQSHPVERIVGVVDDVAVAIGVAGAIAGRAPVGIQTPALLNSPLDPGVSPLAGVPVKAPSVPVVAYKR